MSNIFTLDSMREEIERQFAPCEIDLGGGNIVTLRNVLRLPKKDRDVVYGMLDELGEQQKDEDGEEDNGLSSTEAAAEIALKILPIVADNEKSGQQLVEAIGDDLALILRVFSSWMNGSQAGEADSLDS